jgi:hypothetical protein
MARIVAGYNIGFRAPGAHIGTTNMRGLGFRLALGFAALAAFAANVSAAEFSSLEERMSVKDFKAAGLEKLSPQELEQLNAWLRAHGLAGKAGSAAGGGQSAEEGFRPKGFFGSGSDTGPVQSRIKGTIKGWSGHTLFELENGQAWEQTDGTEFNIPAVTNPGVTIEQGLMGAWNLKIEGYNRSARVTRVR